MTRGTADAIVGALARPTIQNRGHFPAVHGQARRPREPETRSQQVVIVQPAVHRWACDTCPTRGYGGGQLLATATATGHPTYTPAGRHA